jgi:hypothetical protein
MIRLSEIKRLKDLCVLLLTTISDCLLLVVQNDLLSGKEGMDSRPHVRRRTALARRAGDL